MSDIVIRTEGLTKEYRIGQWASAQTRLIELAAQRLGGLLKGERPKPEILRALDGVDIEIQRGEVVGLIGRNGAGKSTLLKILSRITRPTAGYAELHGRVGSLLEAGTGFHPELSGRENIYLTGSIVGLTKRELERRFEEIVDFAGTERFIDTPVKFYSSGMKVRLGFAVSAHLEPDIMLVDEVLAVGDLAFQRKCLDHLHNLTSRGMTIVLVSHHMAAIQSSCQRVFLLEKGRVAVEGSPADVITNYRSLLLGDIPEEEVGHPYESGAGVHILNFQMFDRSGKEAQAFSFGDAPRIRIEVQFDNPIQDPVITFGIRRSDGVVICNFNNWYDNVRLGRVEGKCVVEATLPALRLIPEFYEPHVLVWPWGGVHMHGDLSSGAPYVGGRFTEFEITGPPLTMEDGVFQTPAKTWNIEHSGQTFRREAIPTDEVERSFAEISLSARGR